MNTILIDLTTLNKDELKMASYGIKLFFHKIKDLSLIVVGESNNLLTIKDLDNIKIIDSTNNENALDETLSNNIFSTFVSFRNKSKIVDIANNNFNKTIDSPLYASFFANAYTGRMTLLGDLGYKSFSAKEDFNLFIDSFGSPALAKGGSGDALAGMICALLAQNYEAKDAAITACLAHSLAACKIKNNFALTPTDLIQNIGEL